MTSIQAEGGVCQKPGRLGDEAASYKTYVDPIPYFKPALADTWMEATSAYKRPAVSHRDRIVGRGIITIITRRKRNKVTH